MVMAFLVAPITYPLSVPLPIKKGSCDVEGWKTKDFTVTLTYVKITSSGVNCILKNLRGGKSRSRKGY